MRTPQNFDTLTRPQLRIATAGSVDDGKSTLIGRLLHDSKTIFEDQLDAVAKASRRYGDQELNLALLTDGLRAEREQGITIDVAYRYFATPKRSFVLADTPGHVQYTRNMVTGASIADVAIVLVDARHGVVEQTRRHLGVSSLLGVRQLILAVNKMDLVDWDQATFDRIVRDVESLLEELGGRTEFCALPVSALNGDNIVDCSIHASWYVGPPLLALLEDIEDHEDLPVGARLPVQWVLRSGSDYRGYAGQLTGGPFKVGDEIIVLPAQTRSTIASLTRAGREVEYAMPGDSIAVTLTDHIDVGRGDVLVVGNASVRPVVTTTMDADLSWMIDRPLTVGDRYLVKHLARIVPAHVESILHRLNPETLVAEAASELSINDLGRIRITFDEPIVVDPYTQNRVTGRFLLIDDRTNATAGAATVC